MALLAPSDEGPAKFYYTLNKPMCSPMRSRHYGVRGVINTVKCVRCYHLTRVLSLNVTYLLVCLTKYGKELVLYSFHLCDQSSRNNTFCTICPTKTTLS